MELFFRIEFYREKSASKVPHVHAVFPLVILQRLSLTSKHRGSLLSSHTLGGVKGTAINRRPAWELKSETLCQADIRRAKEGMSEWVSEQESWNLLTPKFVFLSDFSEKCKAKFNVIRWISSASYLISWNLGTLLIRGSEYSKLRELYWSFKKIDRE